MGSVTSLHRVSSDKLAVLAADPSGLDELLAREFRNPDGPSGYLDKSVDELQALLDSADVPVRIAPADMPGELIESKRGRVCFGLSPKQLTEISAQLRATTFEALSDRSGADADELDYVRANYERLEQFVADATSRGLGALLTHG